jgi:hypothetical protein
LHHLATLFRASFRVTSTTQTEMYYWQNESERPAWVSGT